MTEEIYTVWRARYRLGIQDPDFEETRYHNAIFVARKESGSGDLHHVTGDLVTDGGMTYERKEAKEPSKSESFHNIECLGWILKSDYSIFKVTLENLETPPRQKKFNTRTMRYERCHPDGSWYGPDEEIPPLLKCTEWIEQFAIPALNELGIIQTSALQDDEATSSASSEWVYDAQYQRYRRWDGSQWIWQS